MIASYPMIHETDFTDVGPTINAVLNRLPTAVAVKQEDGSYRVTTEVYGKKGLAMWLRGQESISKDGNSI